LQCRRDGNAIVDARRKRDSIEVKRQRHDFEIGGDRHRRHQHVTIAGRHLADIFQRCTSLNSGLQGDLICLFDVFTR